MTTVGPVKLPDALEFRAIRFLSSALNWIQPMPISVGDKLGPYEGEIGAFCELSSTLEGCGASLEA
jgi:hypothetical protein